MSRFRPGTSSTSIRTPVHLQVYDLHPANAYGLYQVGLGVHHTGVEIGGVEYAYGGGEIEGTGVFNHEPREMVQIARNQGQNIEFRETILMGQTEKSSIEIQRIVDELSSDFLAKNYNVLSFNCNTFSDALLKKVLGNQHGTPSWINRLAWLGSQVVCLFPDSWGLGGSNPSSSQSRAQENVPLFPGSGSTIGIGVGVPVSASVSASDDANNTNGDAADLGPNEGEIKHEDNFREVMLAAAERRMRLQGQHEK